jgi:hypothetical protein
MAFRGMGLVLAVEGRRRGVGDVRVHRVHVEEGGEAATGLEPREGGVHHDVRPHELARPVAFPVQAREVVEAAVEARLGPVDHRVRDRGPRGVALGLEHLGERHVGGVERVAKLHRAVLGGEERGEDRGHRRLRPGGVDHRLVEHDRVLGERVEVGCRVPRVAVGSGVVRPKRVHEIDDDEGRVGGGGGDGRRAPEGLPGVAGGIESPGFQTQLDVAPGEPGEVDVSRHPAAVFRVRERVQELGEEDALSTVLSRLHDELDPGSVLELGRDRTGEDEAGPPGEGEAENEAAGGATGKRPPHHVVDAHRAAERLDDGRAVERGGPRLDEAVAGVDEIDGRRLPSAGHEGERGCRQGPPLPSSHSAHRQTSKLARAAGRDQTTL